MSEDDRPTHVICGRCEGKREEKAIVQSEDGTYSTLTRACWLCGGIGSVAPAVLRMWIASGRPDSKEDL